jgi:hypothetical protein
VAASLVGLRAESVGGIDDGMAMEVEKEEEKSIGRSSSSSSSVFRKGSGTVVGRSLALYRREYDRQIAELRKKYAAEQERKKREEMQVKKLERERIMLEKAQRLVIKKQQAEIRAREVEEEAKALRLTLVRCVLFFFWHGPWSTSSPSSRGNIFFGEIAVQMMCLMFSSLSILK